MSSESASAEAPDATASESPWRGGFRELVRGFLVLRDLFSYTLPGAAFLAIGLSSRTPAASRLLVEMKEGPAWVSALLGLFASYLTGHLLLTFYHLPRNVTQIPRLQTLWTKLTGREVNAPVFRLSPEELRYRRRLPELFVELDRYQIITDMRRCLAMALVLGVIVFRWWPSHWGEGAIECLLAAAGVVTWISVLSSPLWGRKLSEFTLQAAREILQEGQKASSLVEPRVHETRR